MLDCVVEWTYTCGDFRAFGMHVLFTLSFNIQFAATFGDLKRKYTFFMGHLSSGNGVEPGSIFVDLKKVTNMAL